MNFRDFVADTKMPLNLTKMNYEGLKQAWGHVMQQGGHYAPSTCQSRERTAIIIPYRDRQANLHVLLNNLIPFLIRQQADFTVFLVEQVRVCVVLCVCVCVCACVHARNYFTYIMQ